MLFLNNIISIIWIATGLIRSSVNWAFTCYRNNQREINRHLKMFLFHPFLNIWYLLNDILGDILSETLSDSCSSASDYLRQTWYHCAMRGRDLFLEVHEDNLDMYLWAEQKKLICILLGKWCHFLSHLGRWTKNVVMKRSIKQRFRSNESLEYWSTPRRPHRICN